MLRSIDYKICTLGKILIWYSSLQLLKKYAQDIKMLDIYTRGRPQSKERFCIAK